jgi:hypothetical protein
MACYRDSFTFLKRWQSNEMKRRLDINDTRSQCGAKETLRLISPQIIVLEKLMVVHVDKKLSVFRGT